MFAGIAASLLAAYAKPLLDKLGNKVSSSLRSRNQAKMEAFDNHVSSLHGNLEKQILESIDVNYYRLRSLHFFLMALSALITLTAAIDYVPNLIVYSLGVLFLLCMMASYGDMRAAHKLKAVIETAKSD